MTRRKTGEAYEKSVARKRQRKLEAMTIDTTNWRLCGWCGKGFNPPVVKTWQGKVICPTCEMYPRVILHRLLEFKIVKLRKKSKLPSKRTRPFDWGHLGTFDPERPWMKWTRCEFCTIPQCVNNNAEHKIRIQTYKGHTICGKCVSALRIFNKKLVKMKYMRMRD